MAKLTETQRDFLKKASWTFGYRENDNRPTFIELKAMGFVYETVRAWYITDAGRAALKQEG